MEQWQVALDRWLTTPPENDDTDFYCEKCDEPFYPDDKYYMIEGECLCQKCAEEWLDAQAEVATEGDCYGEK